MISKLRGYEWASAEAFKRAKQERRSPIEIAQEIASELSSQDWVERAEVVNGYVNVKLSVEGYKRWLKERPGKKDKKVAIEYVSVNPNKPWHIGHLRNALIGQVLGNVYDYHGYDVVRLDYIDDLGLQVAQSYWHYLKYGLKEHPRMDWAVGLAYVEAAQLFEEYEKEIREILKEMEEKGIAREFVEKVLEHQLITAANYGIKHHMRVFESDIARLFDRTIALLKEKGFIVYQEEGELKGTWTTKDGKVVIRSDGTATYLGKDIVFQLWKMGWVKGIRFVKRKDPTGEVWYSWKEGEEKEINADIVVNVIGMEQSLPQSQIAKLVKEIYPEKEYIHVAYQRVRLKDKAFSGRKGTWVGYSADELLEEGIKRIKSKELALAAIKFFILKYNPSKEVIFDWNKALSTEGDSGIYIMYSYVRARSVWRKSGMGGEPELREIDDVDRELGKWLVAAKEYWEKALSYHDPSALADYALELASAFNSYYSKVRILGNENKLFFTYWTMKRLEETLNLLGIDVVEEM
ncbi:MAG: arginine--tRNA ligase [Candidatus Micrarchaeota archaeon]|nr:arginine--tRNA ligase [Candidatus Micrarchaeota archaeon]